MLKLNFFFKFVIWICQCRRYWWWWRRWWWCWLWLWWWRWWDRWAQTVLRRFPILQLESSGCHDDRDHDGSGQWTSTIAVVSFTTISVSSHSTTSCTIHSASTNDGCSSGLNYFFDKKTSNTNFIKNFNDILKRVYITTAKTVL